MGKFKQKFERYEQKYLLSESQYHAVLASISPMTKPDQYGKSRICNIYFDTPEWSVIRRSLEKPVYKEKLRLRCYGVPNANSNAFVEIKKKFKGIVYKRRVDMKYGEAYEYLCRGAKPPVQSQITNEVDWFVSKNPGLRPAMMIAYDRTAFYGIEDDEFRITFDSNIAWRTDDVELTHGSEGIQLLEEGQYLMEIKIQGAMPLWMSAILDKNRVFPASFSKYGAAYRVMCGGNAAKAGINSSGDSLSA